jgi:predicted trehalose synthase
MIPASDIHARWLVRTYCGKHIDETPKGEPSMDWIARALRTEAALNAALKARVNRINFNEVVSTLEELREVHAGTHPDIEQNATLTINNVPKMLEDINKILNEQIGELLSHTEPMTRRAEDKVSA